MFQFLRRVSGSLLPRPDRPWRDDATSHAPTIGRKRTYSTANHDVDDSVSASKRTKNDPAKLDTQSDSSSEEESPKADRTVERQDVKEVTKGVKGVDLEDADKAENVSSIRPDCVPLPDSPSGSPEPESDSPEPIEETEDQDRGDDKDSLASSAPEDNVEQDHEDDERSEAAPVVLNVDTPSATDEVPVTVVSGKSDPQDPSANA